ncbi:sigma factor, partial [Brevundimonas sp.]|uniref:sigma factor n=1 Tax=Brevundimonas sp. TaxID=1871086 RepID=UPI0028ACF5FB
MNLIDTSPPGTYEGADERYQRAAGQFGPALSRLVSGYEANAAERQDLLQEIHLQLWRSLARFDCGSAWKRDPVSGVIGVE